VEDESKKEITMLGLYSDFAGLDADTTTTTTPIQQIADQIFGIMDTQKKRDFELKMATLNAQQQQALAAQTAAAEGKWTTPLTVGAIAVAGIVGLLIIRSLRK
jgi:hypothetical protein